MANPRKVLGWEGIDPLLLTFLIDAVSITYDATQVNGSAVAGKAVRLMPGTAKTVELVGDGEVVFGRLDHVEADGTCAVQVQGECKLPQASSADVVIGNRFIGGLGPSSAEGYIKPPSADVAGNAAARHLVLDDTNAASNGPVVVLLGY